MLKDLKTALLLASLLLSHATFGYFCWIVGDKDGIQKGRGQYHDELIQELDAKGGAPVLLYPPSRVKAVSEGSEYE